MKLTDINRHGYWQFCEEPATFRSDRFNLPSKWDYVYTNGKALLRVKNDGGGYLQMNPPGGPPMFHQERGESTPALFAWIIPDEGKRAQAFSNFRLPMAPCERPGTEPDEYTCTFSPEAARYRLCQDGWVVETEYWVPPDAFAVVMTVSVTNATKKARRCTLMPVLRPHMAPFSLAPWDVPHIYQTSAFCRIGKAMGMWLETRDPGGHPERRLRGAFVTDLAATAFEVARGAFCGKGEWSSPQAVWKGGLARKISRAKAYPYGKVNAEVAALGQPIVAALERKVTLRPGAKTEFTVVFGKLPETTDGSLPPKSEALKLAQYLDSGTRVKAHADIRERYAELFSIRQVETPDEAFDRYVNEWVPLQLEWVTLLDRGWPTGGRGTRDAAQDTTGMIPLDPALGRRRLIEIFTPQRLDGSFLRGYSTDGPDGIHDHRPYVDSACWVWEFLWKYLCYTRDFDILKERLRWLDTTEKSTLLDHVLRLFEYYLDPENIGEHGLVKIREGDWNDGINAAGLEGRGETVMVSCQVVLGLEQAGEFLNMLSRRGVGKLAAPTRKYAAGAKRLRANIVKHALNRQGYFNGLFNDAGKWIFTPKDPDGRRRVNGPANSFAVIAGIAQGKTRDKVFDALNWLKGPNGWRLFYPPLGNPPIEKLGRIGHGDKTPGLSENGTVYNHGAQGFLGRAAWVAGRGTMLHEVLRYMFSYDQKAHPVEVAKTPPYGVVNHWREAIGLEGTGGDTFLSGSISTALRNVYQGMVGFRPGLADLVIDPCIPASWDKMSAEVPFLGGRFSIQVSNPDRVECGVAELKLDGRTVTRRVWDDRLEREVVAIDIAKLKHGANHRVDIVLGKSR